MKIKMENIQELIPTFSIIIPVYNVEKYISNCIESILNQSFFSFELILVIDGSLDNSEQICLRFSQKDNRIKVLSKENGGPGSARNLGIENSIGKFIYFVDADDWIEKDLLLDCSKVLHQGDFDIVGFGYKQDNFNKKGELISSNEVIPDRIAFEKRKKNLRITNNDLKIFSLCCNKIFKRTLIEDNHLRFETGFSLSEDVIFNFQSFIYANKLFFIDKSFYHYINRHTTSLAKQFHDNTFEIHLKSHTALTELMSVWKLNINKSRDVLSNYLIKNVRFTINMLFSYKNDMSHTDKVKYIGAMISSPEVESSIIYYKPYSLKDYIYKYLIKFKMAKIISLFASFLKKNTT